MRKQFLLVALGLTVSGVSQAATLHFECASKMTINELKKDYSKSTFRAVGQCLNKGNSPAAFVTLNLDTDSMYAEVGEDRCAGNPVHLGGVSAHISWFQRASVEAFPSVYRFETPNPLSGQRNMFAYELTRTKTPELTMLRMGWKFECQMSPWTKKQPAF